MSSNTEKNPSSSDNVPFSKTSANVISTAVNQLNKFSPLERRLRSMEAYSCSNATSSDIRRNCFFITPEQFAELISDNSDKHERRYYPIIDCRSQIDFGCERIRSSHNINCRAKIMARKLTSKRLEDVEPSLSASLSSSDSVIIYDQSTDLLGEEKICSLPIVQAAKNSNKNVHIIQGRNKMHLLEKVYQSILGGFNAIKIQYPHLIEGTVAESRNKQEPDYLPPTDVLEKGNMMMTEILPHIFVGMYSKFFFFSARLYGRKSLLSYD